MRILLTTDAVGGVWRYSAILAGALSQQGHAVLLAVIGTPSADRLAELPATVGLEVCDARLEWQDGAEADLVPTAEWIGEVARRWRPDVIHLNQMTYTGLTTFGAPTVVVAHSDVCSWFVEVHGRPAPVEWVRYRQLVRAGLRAADRVVAPSRYQADLIVDNYGPLPVTVIHNGVDDVMPGQGECIRPTDVGAIAAGCTGEAVSNGTADVARPAAAADAFRTPSGTRQTSTSAVDFPRSTLPSGATRPEAVLRQGGIRGTPDTAKVAKPVAHDGSRTDRDVPPDRQAHGHGRRRRLRLLTVGRAWDQAKGIPILEQALLALGEDAPETHLIGPLAAPGSAYSWRPRRLIWEGELSRAETARQMTAADVYVAPSVYEPFGLAPVEAVLCGCALLLSDIGSFRELWDGHAEFVRRGSAAALAEGIARLCQDPEHISRLAAAARAHAVEHFNVDRFTEGYLKLYASLLGRTSPHIRASLPSTRSH